MNKEQLLRQPMVVCKFCGWEIMQSAVWIKPICEDCEQLQEREGAR
jgi:hypothetical protein